MEPMLPAARVLAELKLAGRPPGPVAREDLDWEMPLAPTSAMQVPVGLDLVTAAGREVLQFSLEGRAAGSCRLGARVLLAGEPTSRSYNVTASVRPLETAVVSTADRDDAAEALAGVVFRLKTVRHFYLFGLEGGRRVVLLRRWDDEWLPLAEHAVTIPDAFVTLEVELDGDAIRCRCPELGVDFFVTDTLFPEGKAGVWALGRAQVAALAVTQNPSQARRDDWRHRQAAEAEAARSALVPDPEWALTLDLEALGAAPEFSDFMLPGRHDLLVPGPTLRALTAEGEPLWEAPVALTGLRFSRGHGPHGRLIYGFTGQAQAGDEMVVLQGSNGAVVARAPVPPLAPECPFALFTPTSGDLTGGGPFDIVLFEWHGPAMVYRLWAYDRELRLLWNADMSEPTAKAPYGHANAVQLYDANGDGRDEVLSGGTLYAADGTILWVHDRNAEMDRITHAHHYDAAVIGDFADDPDLDPTVFLVSSSAGVYVVEGRTGRTRAVHRIGHAQGCGVGKLRDDLPGQQVLVGTRWGNYGVTTLFSGTGDRLWTVQTGDFSGGRTLIRWGDRQLILMDGGLFDGHGRRVKDLRRLGETFSVGHLGSDTSECLAVRDDRQMRLYRPAGASQ